MTKEHYIKVKNLKEVWSTKLTTFYYICRKFVLETSSVTSKIKYNYCIGDKKSRNFHEQKFKNKIN